MLDITKRGTVQVGSVTWEYHGDDQTSNLFYITPMPTWIITSGLPAATIVKYKTSDSTNGSGYAILQVELGVPDSAQSAVVGDIKTRFGVTNPQFLTLPIQAGTVVNLTLPDGEGGTTGMQVSGTDFGANAAIFQVPLSADQVTTLESTLANQGGSPFVIQYNMTVPARMPAVTVNLAFDSTIAFNYQVTAHEHTHWASSSTWTYDIAEQLSSSNASTITVKPSDPNLPPSVIDNLRTWAQATIQDLVAKEVAAALALQSSAGGTQSFTVNEISSFSETYNQDEVVLWRLQPQAVLPSFGDLGLTPAQIDSLEPTVDKRQFVVTVTPQCLFVGSGQGGSIKSGPNDFLSPTPLTNLSVTVEYPTLTSDAQRTFVFTGNTPHQWVADWDDTAGGVYTLKYTATYSDHNNTQVQGSAQSDATQYTLGLAEIGTLSVTFDASRFFAAGSSWAALIDQIIIDFAFNTPGQTPLLQTATIKAADTTYQATFASLFLTPITSDYVYTVSYIFKPTAAANPFTSDAKLQNGQYVRLFAPDFQQSFNVIVGMANVIQANVNFYYEGTPYFPNIPASQALPAPTQSSPIQLSFPKPSTMLAAAAATTNGAAHGGTSWRRTNLLQRNGLTDAPPAIQNTAVTFFGASALSPLSVVGSLILDDFTQINFGPYEFLPQTVGNMVFAATREFSIVKFDASNVVWKDLNNIKIHLTGATYGDSKGATTPVAGTWAVQTISLDPQRNVANNQYFVVGGLPQNYTNLQFTWYAEYVYSSGVKYAHGTTDGNVATLPTTATDATAPGAKPVAVGAGA